MILRYGSYSHADNEVTLSISQRPIYNEVGLRAGYVASWSIQGMILGSSASDLATKIKRGQLTYAASAELLAREVEADLFVIATDVDGIYLSFDMDALDPEHASGVGTPVPAGLTQREAHLACELIAETNMLIGMDLVEAVTAGGLQLQS